MIKIPATYEVSWKDNKKTVEDKKHKLIIFLLKELLEEKRMGVERQNRLSLVTIKSIIDERYWKDSIKLIQLLKMKEILEEKNN